jgi:catechol 2,3-dioxygenase-like lactoylglutathione lyase family enzyme
MNIKSLAHVCIKTRDLERTREFYCGALGLQKVFDFTRDEQVIGFYLKMANDSFIEIFHDENAEPANRRRDLHHFCLETDSIEDLRETLLQRGFAPGEIILGADHTLQFWVKDPNGLDLEFQQYTKQSSQFTGAGVEVGRTDAKA